MTVARMLVLILVPLSATARGSGVPRVELELFAFAPESPASVSAVAFTPDSKTCVMPIDSRGRIGVFEVRHEVDDVAGPAADEQQLIPGLIADLGSDEFGQREAASAALGGMGRGAEGALRDALPRAASAEARVRIRKLLSRITEDKGRDEERRFVERLQFRVAPGSIRAICYSPDGTRLLVAGLAGVVSILDAGDYEEVLRVQAEGALDALWLPGGKRFAVAEGAGDVSVWSAETGERLTALPVLLGGEPYSIDISPDGRWLACSGMPKWVAVWDLSTEEMVHELGGFGDSVGDVSFSPDSKRLATASEDGTVRVWEVAGGEEVFALRGHPDEVWCVDYSPDGRWLVSGGENGHVILWDAATGVQLATDVQEAAYGRHVEFLPDGESLAAATSYGPAHFWKLRTGR